MSALICFACFSAACLAIAIASLHSCSTIATSLFLFAICSSYLRIVSSFAAIRAAVWRYSASNPCSSCNSLCFSAIATSRSDEIFIFSLIASITFSTMLNMDSLVAPGFSFRSFTVCFADLILCSSFSFAGS